VNGFRIADPGKSDLSYESVWRLLGFHCDVYIEDPHHTTPINLTRTKLMHNFLEDEEALRSLIALLGQLWDGGPAVEEWLVRASYLGPREETMEARTKSGKVRLLQRRSVSRNCRNCLCRLANGKSLRGRLRAGGGYSPWNGCRTWMHQ